MLDNIVETKKSLGIKTSFSWELIRLAKHGFMNTQKDDETQKIIAEVIKSDDSASRTP